MLKEVVSEGKEGRRLERNKKEKKDNKTQGKGTNIKYLLEHDDENVSAIK